jgi:hypothetical protein
MQQWVDFRRIPHSGVLTLGCACHVASMRVMTKTVAPRPGLFAGHTSENNNVVQWLERFKQANSSMSEMWRLPQSLLFSPNRRAHWPKCVRSSCLWRERYSRASTCAFAMMRTMTAPVCAFASDQKRNRESEFAKRMSAPTGALAFVVQIFYIV